MTVKKDGFGGGRLDATACGAYEATPEQRRAVTALVQHKATGTDDEQYLLTVLGLAATQDGNE